MKVIHRTLLLVVTIVIIDSCSKTETKTTSSAADASGVLLAGSSGSSKSWLLTSISEAQGGGAPVTVTAANDINPCETDNIFIFSNNAAQTYQQTEGPSTCTVGDPSPVESGSWAFTSDGKSLLIESSVFPNAAQFQTEGLDASSGYFLYYFILNIGKPLTVTQLTSSSMTVTYSGSFVDSGSGATINFVDTIVFTAKN